MGQLMAKTIKLVVVSWIKKKVVHINVLFTVKSGNLSRYGLLTILSCSTYQL